MATYRIYKTLVSEFSADIEADSEEAAIKEAEETAIDWQFAESEESYHAEANKDV